MGSRLLFLLGLLTCGFALAASPEKYPGPDDPAVEAAARAALPRAKTVAIVMKVRGIDGLIADLNAKVIGQEIAIELPGDVLFEFDQAAIRKEAEPTLSKVAELLAAHSRSRVRIEGHTDAKGEAKYNQQLSERRAESVKAWLVTQGAVAANLATRGFGKTKPVAPNAKPDGSDDPAGRQKNRRVEIRIQK
ncbi:MAG: OmpA family protein [Betaproteobacteria bacterium]|nr:OmpA family protein [Betaproteobacteria bacterium]